MNSEEESPVYCRITINGERAELSTHRYIKEKNWDSSKGLAKGRTQDKVDLNDFIATFTQKIKVHETQLMKLGREVTASNIKNALSENTTVKKGIVEIAEYHQQTIHSKIGKGYSGNTVEHYKTTERYIKEFIREHYKCPDFPFSEVKHNFIVEFELYIKGHTTCMQNGTMKHIVRLKRITNFAIENGWLDKSPFLRYKAKYERTNRQFLTLDELTKIERKEFSIPRLQLVKDLFVFACYTGKGYKDMMNLTPENISIRLNGKKWLVGERSKTNVLSDVPLLYKPLEIIERYQTHPEVLNSGKLFPTISNQKLNAYLKEVADLSEVSKALTFYIGRHTFATTICSDNGVPIETISQMLGHTSLRTTQVYQKTTPHKVGFDMEGLERVLNEKEVNAKCA